MVAAVSWWNTESWLAHMWGCCWLLAEHGVMVLQWPGPPHTMVVGFYGESPDCKPCFSGPGKSCWVTPAQHGSSWTPLLGRGNTRQVGIFRATTIL